jgi:hypothetical protein
MTAFSEPVLFACWVSEGKWEIRVDHQHLPDGKRHVHIRKRGRKGEYSWNEDGSRHDKHRFPVSESMIGKAKKIAADRLSVPIDSLKFLTGIPKGGHVVVLHEGLPSFSETYISAEFEFVVLVSEYWLIVVAPHLDDEASRGAVEPA